MCYISEGVGNNRRTDQIPENPARFHCGVVSICWHASRIQINGIWEVAWTVDLLYPLNFTHWSEPTGCYWITENKPVSDLLRGWVASDQGRACQEKIWPKGGGCAPSWAGQRGNKGGDADKGRGHPTPPCGPRPSRAVCLWLYSVLICHPTIWKGRGCCAQLRRAFEAVERAYCRTPLWMCILSF